MTNTPLPIGQADDLFNGHHRGLYPWSRWFDGRAYSLSMRDDLSHFKDMENAIKYIRQVATRKRITVEIRRNTHLQTITIRARLLPLSPMTAINPQDHEHEAPDKETSKSKVPGKDLEAQRKRTRRPVRH